MASNFQLFQSSNNDSIHIYMRGDFDATSAHELINALKKQNRDCYTVFIDTNDLNRIYTFGIDVFQKKMITRIINSRSLVFIGKHKHKFVV